MGANEMYLAILTKREQAQGINILGLLLREETTPVTYKRFNFSQIINDPIMLYKVLKKFNLEVEVSHVNSPDGIERAEFKLNYAKFKERTENDPQVVPMYLATTPAKFKDTNLADLTDNEIYKLVIQEMDKELAVLGETSVTQTAVDNYNNILARIAAHGAKPAETANVNANAEAEQKAKEEAERKAKEEAERLEAERKAKEEVERKAKEEVERKAKEEAERQAKEEAERLEAEQKAKEEAERKAKEEAERQAKLTALAEARKYPVVLNTLQKYNSSDTYLALDYGPEHNYIKVVDSEETIAKMDSRYLVVEHKESEPAFSGKVIGNCETETELAQIISAIEAGIEDSKAAVEAEHGDAELVIPTEESSDSDLNQTISVTPSVEMPDMTLPTDTTSAIPTEAWESQFCKVPLVELEIGGSSAVIVESPIDASPILAGVVTLIEKIDAEDEKEDATQDVAQEDETPTTFDLYYISDILTSNYDIMSNLGIEGSLRVYTESTKYSYDFKTAPRFEFVVSSCTSAILLKDVAANITPEQVTEQIRKFGRTSLSSVSDTVYNMVESTELEELEDIRALILHDNAKADLLANVNNSALIAGYEKEQQSIYGNVKYSSSDAEDNVYFFRMLRSLCNRNESSNVVMESNVSINLADIFRGQVERYEFGLLQHYKSNLEEYKQYLKKQNTEANVIVNSVRSAKDFILGTYANGEAIYTNGFYENELPQLRQMINLYNAALIQEYGVKSKEELDALIASGKSCPSADEYLALVCEQMWVLTHSYLPIKIRKSIRNSLQPHETFSEGFNKQKVKLQQNVNSSNLILVPDPAIAPPEEGTHFQDFSDDVIEFSGLKAYIKANVKSPYKWIYAFAILARWGNRKPEFFALPEKYLVDPSLVYHYACGKVIPRYEDTTVTSTNKPLTAFEFKSVDYAINNQRGKVDDSQYGASFASIDGKLPIYYYIGFTQFENNANLTKLFYTDLVTLVSNLVDNAEKATGTENGLISIFAGQTPQELQVEGIYYDTVLKRIVVSEDFDATKILESHTSSIEESDYIQLKNYITDTLEMNKVFSEEVKQIGDSHLRVSEYRKFVKRSLLGDAQYKKYGSAMKRNNKLTPLFGLFETYAEIHGLSAINNDNNKRMVEVVSSEFAIASKLATSYANTMSKRPSDSGVTFFEAVLNCFLYAINLVEHNLYIPTPEFINSVEKSNTALNWRKRQAITEFESSMFVNQNPAVKNAIMGLATGSTSSTQSSSSGLMGGNGLNAKALNIFGQGGVNTQKDIGADPESIEVYQKYFSPGLNHNYIIFQCVADNIEIRTVRVKGVGDFVFISDIGELAPAASAKIDASRTFKACMSNLAKNKNIHFGFATESCKQKCDSFLAALV